MNKSAVSKVFVGIGSNIEPRTHIPHALRLLDERFGPLQVSQIYRCPAVGFDGDAFLNLVVGFTTGADPLMLVQALHCIEEHCGRPRAERMSSRRMDLDLLLYGDRIIDSDGLCLPRADILRYAFVLKPLAEMVPEQRHPVEQRSYAALWAGFDASGQLLQAVDLDD